jgi:hypothetical protein
MIICLPAGRCANGLAACVFCLVAFLKSESPDSAIVTLASSGLSNWQISQ